LFIIIKVLVLAYINKDLIHLYEKSYGPVTFLVCNPTNRKLGPGKSSK